METRVIPTYQNGCMNSERTLATTEFLNAEAYTPALLMYLWRLREVRIGVNIVFVVISRKTEMARSATGLKSQGPRAEDV